MEGRITLCVTNDILLEYLEIIGLKTSQTVASNVVSAILSKPNIEYVTPFYKFGMISSDPDDNKFVVCAISSGAECIVSNDNHFNVLAAIPFPKVSVLTIKEFLKTLE